MGNLQRKVALMVVDSFIVFASIYVSQFLFWGKFAGFTSSIIVSSLALLVSHHLIAHKLRLYGKIWAYASTGELLLIANTVTISISITALIQYIVYEDVFMRIMIVTWMLHLLLIGGSRFSWRVFRDTYITKGVVKKPTLIVGAGAAGTMVARQLLQHHESGLDPIVFIDDNPMKQQLEIMGIKVVGGTNYIQEAVQKYAIELIVIAIPSLSKSELNTIYKECAQTKVKTQILPMIEDLMLGKVSVNQFRDVEVEDLLGREPVKLDMESVSDEITDKVILVTGAGGSIGSEICRQVAKFNPQQLLLLGHGENSIYTIEMELRNTFGVEIDIRPIIADVQDRERIFEVLNHYRPNVVYHAAAHKHVPLMEENPHEAVKNNVLGTKNVAEAASAAKVERFVMVSTDKAVNPTSVMGATKKIAEMIVQQMDKVSKTQFVAVRFGNVLGSRGSVIPLFKKQIQVGGPVTVTHPDMVRYFMTIPEASRLVIQAGALARGGEIFVLDMGEPVRIVDLAENLIKLSGYNVDEIGITFSGVRPGEKLFEELLGKNEVHDEQVYPKIYIGKALMVEMEVIMNLIERLEEMTREDVRAIVLDIAHGRADTKTKLSLVK